MPSIPITGLSSANPVPGIYVDIQFALGPASAGQGVYSAIILANKLSTGSASNAVIYGPDTATPMLSEQDAIDLFGAGSEAHVMVRRFLASNKSTPLYVCPVAESSGAQADGYIAFTTTAAANGSVEIYIQDVRVEVGIVKGDTVSDMATNAVAALSAHTELPVTFTAVTGSVWVRAKQKGPRGNAIRMSARIIGSGISTTVTPTSTTALSGGTTADDVTNALAAILGKRFYYIIPAHTDATNLGLIKTQIDADALPLAANRERMVSGSVDTLANTITLASGINHPRAEVVWSEENDLTPGELASRAAACYSLEELNFGQASTALNFDSYGFGVANQDRWGVPAPRSGKVPTQAQIESALMNGITPVQVSKSKTSIVKGITTFASNGGSPDYRVRPRHIVTVCDHYADDLVSVIHSRFPNKTLGDDRDDGDPGPVDQVSPKMVKAVIDKLTTDYGKDGLLGEVDAIKAATVVARDPNNSERVNARVPLVVINLLGQVGLRLEQTSTLQ